MNVAEIFTAIATYLTVSEVEGVIKYTFRNGPFELIKNLVIGFVRIAGVNLFAKVFGS